MHSLTSNYLTSTVQVPATPLFRTQEPLLKDFLYWAHLYRNKYVIISKHSRLLYSSGKQWWPINSGRHSTYLADKKIYLAVIVRRGPQHNLVNSIFKTWYSLYLSYKNNQKAFTTSSLTYQTKVTIAFSILRVIYEVKIWNKFLFDYNFRISILLFVRCFKTKFFHCFKQCHSDFAMTC